MKRIGLILLSFFVAGCAFLMFFEISAPLSVKMCAPVPTGDYPAHRDCWQDDLFLILSYVVFGGGTFFIYLIIPRRIIGWLNSTGWRGRMEPTIKRAGMWLIAFVVTCGVNHFFDITTTLYGGNWFLASAIGKMVMFVASTGALYYFDTHLSDYIKSLPSYNTYINLKKRLDDHEKERDLINDAIEALQRDIREAETRMLRKEINDRLNEINRRLDRDL